MEILRDHARRSVLILRVALLAAISVVVSAHAGATVRSRALSENAPERFEPYGLSRSLAAKRSGDVRVEILTRADGRLAAAAQTLRTQLSPDPSAAENARSGTPGEHTPSGAPALSKQCVLMRFGHCGRSC